MDICGFNNSIGYIVLWMQSSQQAVCCPAVHLLQHE